MKRILITGGTGYIGSHTAVVLTSLGHEVFLLDNFSNSSKSILTSLEKLIGRALPFVEGDIRETNLIKNILSKYKINFVIHFAGLKAVGDSVEKPLEYYSNNVQGTLSLLSAMEDQNVFNFIFSSSATVYGEPEYLPFDEKHPIRPINPYGRTKYQVEEICKDLVAANPDFSIACLRYFNPVGCHESGLIGERPKGSPNNLMPYIAQVAIGERDALQVFGDNYDTPDGTGMRDYIHVMDLAEGHAAAIDFLETHANWHAINLGSGQGISVLEMIHAFENVSQQKISYRIVERRAGDIAKFYANPSKASEVLNWQTKRTLEDMCASMWKFYQLAKSDIDIHD